MGACVSWGDLSCPSTRSPSARGRSGKLSANFILEKKNKTPQHDVIGFLVYPAGAPPPAVGLCLAMSLSTTTSFGTTVSLGTAVSLGTVVGDQAPALPAAPRLSQAPSAVNASFTSSSPLPQKASPCQIPSSHQLPGKKLGQGQGARAKPVNLFPAFPSDQPSSTGRKTLL